MPKRSNPFQRLVFLVKMHATTGAQVTESKLIPDRVTGALREVDISIESTVAGHDVIVSIECNSRTRKAHVGWVEEMKSKHERLPTNALVLVSRNGFSREAATVAKMYGFQVLSLGALDAATAKRVFGAAGSIWTNVFHLKPTRVIVAVDASDGLPGEDVAVFPDNAIYASTGEYVGEIKDAVNLLLNADFTFRELSQNGDTSHRSFEIQWHPPPDERGRRVCLLSLEPRCLRQINSLVITGRCNFDIAEFKVKHGTLGSVNVLWGSGSLLGKNAFLVASDAAGTGKFSITTDPLGPPHNV